MKSILLFIFLLFIFLLSSLYGSSQKENIQCYPASWWVGMKNPNLQIMLHGNNLAHSNLSVKYPGVTIKKINKVENANYLFIDLQISPVAMAGTLQFSFTQNNQHEIIPFELKQRQKKDDGKTRIQGVTSSDLIYFLMPDRFSNGDPNNDSIVGLVETSTGRDKMRGRHGGDLKGVENHLDYIKDLGATAIWMTPVIINDMETASYHGYAFTDQYTIDPRFGGKSAYISLISAAHKKGLKIIQDAVYNHVGINHITVKDMPMKDWLNQWPKYQNTSYKDQVVFDPYASAIDRKIMTDGWFTPYMPDLNQRNPFVANYLIQHAIWTTEYFGIDGWRIDTYAYCDKDFMNRCNAALLSEFPQIGIFAETWVHGMVNQTYFVNNHYDIPFKSNLPGVTDFQVHFAIEDILKPNAAADKVTDLYTTLAKDFIYKDAYKNCIFLDNHDMDRFLSTIGGDLDKYKIGINWLLTLRGIPEIYYGTEILMNGTTHPSDALVRKDFPGGWPEDKVNKFSPGGRTDSENIAFNYVKTLANYRKNSSALKTGKLMQYVPYNGLYVYFRYDQQHTIMIVSNTGDKEGNVKVSRFEERTKGFNKMKNIITGLSTPLNDFIVNPGGSGVYELN